MISRHRPGGGGRLVFDGRNHIADQCTVAREVHAGCGSLAGIHRAEINIQEIGILGENHRGVGQVSPVAVRTERIGHRGFQADSLNHVGGGETGRKDCRQFDDGVEVLQRGVEGVCVSIHRHDFGIAVDDVTLADRRQVAAAGHIRITLIVKMDILLSLLDAVDGTGHVDPVSAAVEGTGCPVAVVFRHIQFVQFHRLENRVEDENTLCVTAGIIALEDTA